MIAIMDDVNLASIDLNLFLALEVLVRHQNVTRAGKEMGLSQSAMSNVLGRLRTTLNDPVLVRTSKGMMPTPRAVAILEPVQRGLAAFGDALREEASFEPAAAEGIYRIGVTDHSGIVLMPQLAERLQRDAPGIDLELHAWSADRGLRDLEQGRLDLVIAVGPIEEPPAGIYRGNLFRDEFVCMVREGHPDVGDTLDLDTFASVPHLLVAPGGTRGGLVDTALAKHDRERRIAMLVPHFGTAPLVVAHSDLLVTLSRTIAVPFSKWLPLKLFAPPVELQSGFWWMAWHERTHQTPSHLWLRNAVRESASGVMEEHS